MDKSDSCSNATPSSEGVALSFSVEENVSLKKYHTFSLPVFARYFCVIDSEQTLSDLLEAVLFKSLPHVFIGEGSNTVFLQDFPGLVVKLEMKGLQLVFEDERYVHLKVSAGESWHHVVEYTLSRNWFGLENLSLIPGTAGAAPIQNIGAYGVELKDVLVELSAIDVKTGQAVLFSKQECHFAYRDSRFKQEPGRYVITSISLKLSKTPEVHADYSGIKEELEKYNLSNPSPQQLSRVICAIRRNKLPDPSVLANAGSFFKNPVVSAFEYQSLQEKFPEIKSHKVCDKAYKIHAAWLIESCGFKGKEIHNIGVYEKQALVLTNNGKASGAQLKEAVEEIVDAVKNKFLISLEIEPVMY